MQSSLLVTRNRALSDTRPYTADPYLACSSVNTSKAGNSFTSVVDVDVTKPPEIVRGAQTCFDQKLPSLQSTNLDSYLSSGAKSGERRRSVSFGRLGNHTTSNESNSKLLCDAGSDFRDDFRCHLHSPGAVTAEVNASFGRGRAATSMRYRRSFSVVGIRGILSLSHNAPLKRLPPLLGLQRRTVFCSSRPTCAAEQIKPQLILSFDINKTIVLEDSAGSKSMRDVCNETLADCCWGSISGVASRGNTGDWVPASDVPLSVEPPKDAESLGLVSYTSYAAKQYRNAVRKTMHLGDTVSSKSRSLARSVSRDAKVRRDKLRCQFAEVGGPAPEAVAALLPRLLDTLALPEEVRNAKGADIAGLAQRESVFLLPSFLAGVRWLSESGVADNVDVSLHLRTFGSDFAAVATEFNAFACGEHPRHRGFRCDGFGGTVDRRLQLEDGSGLGSFFRDSDGPILAFGTGDLPKAGSREEALSLARSNGTDVAVGTCAIHALLSKKSQGGRSLCLVDHWEHWRDDGEAGTAGKLLTVGPCSPATAEEVFGRARPKDHALLVDDNARGPDGHIVDVRCGTTGECLPWAESLARGHVVTASPLDAVLDDDYFVRIITRAASRCFEGCSQQTLLDIFSHERR